MGHMGQRVLKELGRLQDKLQHTTSLLKKRVAPKATVPQSNHKPAAPVPHVPARSAPSTPTHVVLHVDTSSQDKYSKSVLNKLGEMEAELKKVTVEHQTNKAQAARPHSVDQVINHYEKMEHHEVPVNDFSEGHNWSHEGETDFIFGGHHHHDPDAAHKPDKEERKLKVADVPTTDTI